MRSRLAVFITIVQSIIFTGHLFVYATWAVFWGGVASGTAVKIALAMLSISFVSASLLGWYFHNRLVRLYYTVAAFWLGLSSYLMWAAVLCWLTWGFSVVARLNWTTQRIADVLFAAAVLTAVYGIINAAWLRVVRVTVQLPNLPEQWRGRTAALVTDTHLGHIRNGRFVRRVVRKLTSLRPDVVFLAGDVYDGTAADFEKLAEPWAELIANLSNPGAANAESHHGDTEARRNEKVGSSRGFGESQYPASAGGLRAEQGATAVLEEEGFLGVYYILGNHEEFYSHAEFLPPLENAGVRFLNNEKADLDGLQLVGVHYRDAVGEERYRQVLRRIGIDRSRASVLLLHAPVRLAVAEEEGISLQLSGHTHGGQFFPYTLIAKRVWGKFIHGLQQLGNLQVFTSYGAGTWGPPMRVGTRPEIVLITLE
ncbi:MAG TPA: metallophosphoesterase [Candidatus Angelobacter sp.]|nr:metallophosphoesterase [Candidatus Angelobacter sp.]